MSQPSPSPPSAPARPAGPSRAAVRRPRSHPRAAGAPDAARRPTASARLRPAGRPLRVEDPYGLAVAVGRLGLIDRRSAKVPVAILSAVLQEGDVVELLAHGRYRGYSAVGALVGPAVVLVNDRPWKADVIRIDLAPGLEVHGWQDDRAASLTFAGPGGPEALEGVGDRALAVEMAQRVRDRVAGPAPRRRPAEPPPSPAADPPPGPPVTRPGASARRAGRYRFDVRDLDPLDLPPQAVDDVEVQPP